ADQLVLLEHRHREDGSKAREFDVGDQQRIALHVGLFRRDIVDEDHLLCSDQAAKGCPRTGTDQSTSTVFRKRWRCVVQRGSMKRISVAEIQRAELGLAEPRRVRQDGLEHRLQVTGRTGDGVQYLRSRRLLLQRLTYLGPKSSILLLQVYGRFRSC